MIIETKYAIGDTINLFGYEDWKCVITAILYRASGQTEYQLEWNNDGDAKCEWFEEKRLSLLEKISGREPARGIL